MALVSCPECQAQVSDKAAACPHCGCPITPAAPPPPPPEPSPPSPHPCPDCGQGFDIGMDLYHHRKKAHRGGWVYNQAVTCPHCHVKGQVAIRAKADKDISGGKATAAVLTAGWSLLATGLSRKGIVTEAYCANCKARWTM